MKLYLSSYRIPTLDDLSSLIGKPLRDTRVAFIPNAQDYCSAPARDYKISVWKHYFEGLGLATEIVDLREYSSAQSLRDTLAGYDLIWGMGGNTFCLRYEMRRSGFDEAILPLLTSGIVYGGESAGALVAGTSIAGIESADIPAYAKEVINDGLHLVPYVILPHTDNPEFAEAVQTVRKLHTATSDLIELTDKQAVIFDANKHWIVETDKIEQHAPVDASSAETNK